MNASISHGFVVRGIVAAGLLLVATHGSWAAAAFTVPAGERQLFLDDVGIAKVAYLKRTMHAPAKKGAVIRPDWNRNETTLHIASAPSWDRDANVFKLLVTEIGGPVSASTIWQSKDGLHWSRLGKPSMNFYCMVYDGTDPDPARRYKAFRPNKGFFVSPDALRWTKLDVPPVPSADEWNFSFDEKGHLFIVTVKMGGPYGRSHGLSTSKDFKHWTRPELIFHADERDQELGRIYVERRRANPALQQARYHTPSKYAVDVYILAVFRYESLYVGLPMMFYQTGPNPTYPNQDGFEEIQLICSRDLHNWKRVGNRAPFITSSPLGSGAYDLSQICPPSSPVLWGEELWFYYSGFKYTHESLEYADGKFVSDPGRDRDASAICLAVLRRDGFVSLDADAKKGTVVTKPFKAPGGKLFVNVDAFKGQLLVEALDPNDAVLAASEPMKGDLLSGEVKWQSGDLAGLKGKTTRLRFTLENASLYSYWME